VTNLDEIDFGKGLIVPRLLNIQNTNNILMIEVSQQLHLAKSPQTEHTVVEWSNLLDCNLLA